MKETRTRAFTMVELLVVVLILGLLATIAIGVFTTQVERARYAAARSMIHDISVGLERYNIDLGEYPSSGSAARPFDYPADGCGFMQLSLIHSMSGNSQAPGTALWKGPYLNVQREYLGDFDGTRLEELGSSIEMGDVQILDPWHQPYRYVRFGPEPDSYFNNYATMLPSGHPFAATETFYNPSTFQIVSKGMNMVTGDASSNSYGMQPDDVSNFGM